MDRPTGILLLALLCGPAVAAYVTQPPSPPGGLTGQVQFNNAGALGGTSALTATPTTVAVPGLAAQGQVCNSAAGALSTSTTACPGVTNAAPVPPIQNQSALSVSALAATTTQVMGGLGTSCTLTPASSGVVAFTFYGHGTTGSGLGFTVNGRYGTGAAPAKTAALTGTSGTATQATFNGTQNIPFSVSGVVALTPGTAYWFDLAIAATASGTVNLVVVGCAINEVP